ncbi:hypothetical protein [Candidatus Marinarcus aquaticus]|uniref:Uncharacterized protein n=1 Tax=Candidatus Marinarcus aquaticus TaxID=2044504 RepID=A0A4Q0XMT1_9BACT|nr:hypothetical protein [Candidatus Marinarcus aquaticus]RXJ55286.1 hypothetical protein CRV04_10635 [Candidatus Marinarcus aquaticus]
MKSIIALENLIKEAQERVDVQRRQLNDHESGERRLTRLAKTATETNLEETSERLVKYKALLEEFLAQDQEELAEKERIEAAIERKKYFDHQNIRLQNNIEINSDQKIEASLILDELPEEICIEDDILIDIAIQSLDLNISSHIDLYKKHQDIKQEFTSLTQKNKQANLKDIGLLNVKIPILILQFSTLIESILETIKTENKPEFAGLPKYEDWWIQELWSSHQAYFALYKWKYIISNLCITNRQKRAWSKVFDTWVFIKKMLNDKGAVAFEIHQAFDTLISKYVSLEEELETVNLISMEKIIKKITQNEDFTTVRRSHDVITPYLEFKRNRLNPKKEDEEALT